MLHEGCFFTSTAETGFHQNQKARKTEVLGKLSTSRKANSTALHLTPSYFVVAVSLDLSLVAFGSWEQGAGARAPLLEANGKAAGPV